MKYNRHKTLLFLDLVLDMDVVKCNEHLITSIETKQNSESVAIIIDIDMSDKSECVRIDMENFLDNIPKIYLTDKSIEFYFQVDTQKSNFKL